MYQIEEREARPVGMPWKPFLPPFTSKEEAKVTRKICAENAPWYRYRVVQIIAD
jgi:hypothetical protein